jgi:hypothetical protein
MGCMDIAAPCEVYNEMPTVKQEGAVRVFVKIVWTLFIALPYLY